MTSCLEAAIVTGNVHKLGPEDLGLSVSSAITVKQEKLLQVHES